MEFTVLTVMVVALLVYCVRNHITLAALEAKVEAALKSPPK